MFVMNFKTTFDSIGYLKFHGQMEKVFSDKMSHSNHQMLSAGRAWTAGHKTKEKPYFQLKPTSYSKLAKCKLIVSCMYPSCGDIGACA